MSDVTQTLRILLDVNSTANALSSLVILALIHGLRLRIRGYILLIYSMTVCQFIFDAALLMLFECNPTDMDCLNSVFFLASSFGIASQGWSLVIALIVAYIIASRRRFNIDKYYYAMAFIITISSVSVGTIRVLASLNLDSDFPISTQQSIYIYDAMRYLEIVVNLGVIGIIFTHLRHMNYHEMDNNPIYVLAKKLLLYPAVQLISRIGSTQYEDFYSVSFPSDADGWSMKSIQAVIYCILTPLGGFLSLVIFLHVQPKAMQLLFSVLTCTKIHEPEYIEPALSNESSPEKLSQLKSGGGYLSDDDPPVDIEEENHHSASSSGNFDLEGSPIFRDGIIEHSSLSTVFSSTHNRNSINVCTPHKLADWSEEQLVEAIATGSGSIMKSLSTGSLLKSMSNSSLHQALLKK